MPSTAYVSALAAAISLDAFVEPCLLGSRHKGGKPLKQVAALLRAHDLCDTIKQGNLVPVCLVGPQEAHDLHRSMHMG